MSESVYQNNHQKLIFFRRSIEENIEKKLETQDKIPKKEEIEKIYFHGMNIHSKKFQRKINRKRTVLNTILINSLIIISAIMVVALCELILG